MRTPSPLAVLGWGAVLLGLAALASAQPPTAVPDLISRLASPDPAQRTAADHALETLGAPALEPLRAASRHPHAEVRRRARRLVPAIEHRLEADRLLQPTRVRLVYRDTPLAEAVADLGRQTGFAARLEGNVTDRLTFDSGEVPVWEAVTAFCRHAGLADVPRAGLADFFDGGDRLFDIDGLRPDGKNRPQTPLLLRKGEDPGTVRQLRGALSLRAVPPEVTTRREPAPGSERRLGLELRLEPRLRLLAILAVRVDRAVDEHDQVLTQPVTSVAGAGALAEGLNEEVLLLWDGESAPTAELPGQPAPAQVRLRGGEKPARRLKEVRGAVAFVVQASAEALVALNDPAAGKSITGRDQSSLKVVSLEREPAGVVRLRVEVVPPAQDLYFAGQPARLVQVAGGRWRGRGLPAPSPVAATALAVVDNRGRTVLPEPDAVPSVGSAGAAWDFTLTYRLADGAVPTRLVYTDRRSVTLEVPFDLRDVPLP